MILLEDLSESEIKEVSQHVSDSFYIIMNIAVRIDYIYFESN